MGRTKGAIHENREMGADALREILKPIFQQLAKAGVPEARLPSNDAIVSKILEWVDQKKIDAWVKAYVQAMK